MSPSARDRRRIHWYLLRYRAHQWWNRSAWRQIFVLGGLYALCLSSWILATYVLFGG